MMRALIVALALLPGVIAAEDSRIPAPPASPLDDAPLTEAEKAAGVRLIPGGGRVDFKKKTLVIPAMVCIQEGLIELFACADGGKDHESVLRLRCRPELINLNLTLFGLKKGPARGDGTGDRLAIFCEWERDGKTVAVRAEEMIWNETTKSPMDPVGWTFTGSQFLPEHDADTGKPTGRKIFGAVQNRTMIATFGDPLALIETPLPEGVDDSAFVANKQVVPPPQTAVRVIIRPATPEELAQMKKTEAQLGEARRKVQPHGKLQSQAGPGDVPPTRKGAKEGE